MGGRRPGATGKEGGFEEAGDGRVKRKRGLNRAKGLCYSSVGHDETELLGTGERTGQRMDRASGGTGWYSTCHHPSWPPSLRGVAHLFCTR